MTVIFLSNHKWVGLTCNMSVGLEAGRECARRFTQQLVTDSRAVPSLRSWCESWTQVERKCPRGLAELWTWWWRQRSDGLGDVLKHSRGEMWLLTLRSGCVPGRKTPQSPFYITVTHLSLHTEVNNNFVNENTIWLRISVQRTLLDCFPLRTWQQVSVSVFMSRSVWRLTHQPLSRGWAGLMFLLLYQ